jgi:hypothetical protein
MTNLDCSRAEDLLDLYAAGECDDPTQKEMRAHLAKCSSCREKLGATRNLQGLLELHHRAPAALARLQQRIAREARPPAAIRPWPGAQRFAAVAALLLVAFALALWVPGATSRRPPLALRAELSTAKMDLAPMRETVVRIQPGAKALSLPVVKVELRNPTDRTLFVHIGPNYRLELRGPGVSTAPTGRPFVSPFPPEVAIPPRGKVSLPMDKLVELTPKGPRYLFPTVAGDYSLTVHLRVTVQEEGGAIQSMTVKAGPTTLVVEQKQ